MVQQLKRLFAYPGFITLMAFAARVTVLWTIWYEERVPARYFVPYGFELGRVAASIAAGKGFSSPLRLVDTGPTAWFTPIYPYLAAGVFKIWGIYSEPSKLILQVLNCVFASLTVIPVYFMAEKCFGKGVATASAWLWVFVPTALYFRIIWIWDTVLAALFMALIFWATLEVAESKSTRVWAGYGALWVTGALVNPSIISLFPFLAGWALWRSREASSSWTRFAGATLLVFAIGLVPWTVRNYIVFRKFIPLRSNFGLELWMGNNPDVTDNWSPTSHPNDDPKEAEKYKQMGEVAYMAEKEHEGVAFIRTHPLETVNFIFHRFVATWLDESDSPIDVWSNAPLYVRVMLGWNILWTLATFLGAMFVYRVQGRYAFPLAMTLLVFPLVFYLTHSSLRYRFPIDPILVVLSVYGASYPLCAVRSHAMGGAQAGTPSATIPPSQSPSDAD